jgi:hypothetical protein
MLLQQNPCACSLFYHTYVPSFIKLPSSITHHCTLFNHTALPLFYHTRLGQTPGFTVCHKWYWGQQCRAISWSNTWHSG